MAYPSGQCLQAGRRSYQLATSKSQMSFAIEVVPLVACAKFIIHYKVGYQG
jgi:hypothetical protein